MCREKKVPVLHFGRGSTLVLILLMLLLTLNGCARKPDGQTPTPGTAGKDVPAASPIGRMLTGMTELRLWRDSVLLLTVKDADLLELLRAPLQQATPMTDPEPLTSSYALSFVDKQGQESSLIPFAFKETIPSIYREFIQADDRWYQCAGVKSVLDCLIRQGSSTLRADDLPFLESYGWESYYQLNEYSVRLPERLVHAAGEQPAPLYWAVANVFCRQIGLDIAPALGQQVDITVYRLKTSLPDAFGPNRVHGRAVIVHHEGKIIGAWLTILHYLTCSLDGESFADLTGLDYRDWVAALADRDNPIDQDLAKLTPEDVVKEYFAAIDRKDYLKAHQLESRGYLLESSLYGIPAGTIYSDRFYEEINLRSSFFGSCKSIKLLRIELDPGYPDEPRPDNILVFYVELEIEPEPDGQLAGPPCFIHLIKETEATGWRVRGLSTSP